MWSSRAVVVTNQTRQPSVSPALLLLADVLGRSDSDKTIKTRQTPDTGITGAISRTSHLTLTTGLSLPVSL